MSDEPTPQIPDVPEDPDAPAQPVPETPVVPPVEVPAESEAQPDDGSAAEPE